MKRVVSDEVVSDKQNEIPVAVPEPMFRRYRIKVKAGVRVGALPVGDPRTGL